MPEQTYPAPPRILAELLDEATYQYFLRLHRDVYGVDGSIDGTLDRHNIEPVEQLKTDETDPNLALKPTGEGGGLEFRPVPDGEARILVAEADPSMPNGVVPVAGANIELTDNGNELVIAVGAQGAGGELDADRLDGREAANFVWSIKKVGEAALNQDVTFSEGTGVTLTQVGQDIEIAATGGGAGSGDEVLAWFLS